MNLIAVFGSLSLFSTCFWAKRPAAIKSNRAKLPCTTWFCGLTCFNYALLGIHAVITQSAGVDCVWNCVTSAY